MMRHFSRASIFSMMALGSLSMASVSYAQQSNVPAAQAEHARREMAVREAYQAVQEARLAYVARRYSDAVEHYKAALASVPGGESTKKLEKFIRDSLSDALIAKAMDYRLVGRRDEAIAFLQEALKYAPDNKRAEAELNYTLDPVRTNPALNPQHVADVEEVKRLLDLGYGYLDLGKYDDAITVFKSISKYDAYNSAAQQGIESALKRKSAALRTSHNATRAAMLNDVEELWLKGDDDEALPELGGDYSEELHPVDEEIQEVYAAGIASVMIPQIVLEDADIMQVVEALQLQIRAAEAEGRLNGNRKINITTNFGPSDSKGYKDITAQTVNLKLRDVSVKEVLDILASQLGISYYYTTTGVEISFSGKDFGPLLDRTFSVPPHFFDVQADEESEDEDDGFEESGRIKVHRVNPIQALKGMGVSFPEGATARYSSSSRQLFVRNTSYNLEEIQDLLNEPLTEQRQVVLNVVVMEIAENELEQLGFDWLFNVNINGEFSVSGAANQAASTATGLPVFGSVTQGGEAAPYATSGLRSGTAVLSPDNMEHLISSGGVSSYHDGVSQKSPGIFGIRGVWNAVDVTFMMNGLSQSKGADILRNPRLIFSPGLDEQVSFADVTEMFFPETWVPSEISTFNGFINNNNDDEDNNNASGSTVATGAIPSDFVRFGMSEDGIGGFGTILQVHSAEISENGQFVTLALTTTTNEFEGFINWGSPINSAIYDGSGRIEYYQISPNYILQPMIKRYVENTKITLVPGSVLVMGGLKEAKHVRFEDKVPVLGDLPLVGRLFRSEGEQKIRKALIYFVKVDLVDPTGRDVKTGERPSSFTDSF